MINPANLGTVWSAHSKPMLSALNSLHGLHGMLVDKTGSTVRDSQVSVSINKTAWSPAQLSSGHFWRLLSVGQHEVSVDEVTKLVNIVPGRVELVKFEVNTGSSSTLLFLITSSFIILILFVLWKRRWINIF